MADILEFINKNTAPTNLVGRLLMLNVALVSGPVPKFQCGGFLVNSRRMIEIVTESSQQEPIRRAIESGLLIDVTDSEIAKKGFELKNSSTSRIQSEDTDKKAFVSKDKLGRMIIAVPKDDDERKDFEKQIAENGYLELNPEESEEFTGFTGVIEEEELTIDVKP